MWGGGGGRTGRAPSGKHAMRRKRYQAAAAHMMFGKEVI